MIDWQNIVVGLIFVAVVAWVIRAILRAIAARRYTRCSSCDDAACPYRKTDKKKVDY